jgi:hypothetical protein
MLKSMIAPCLWDGNAEQASATEWASARRRYAGRLNAPENRVGVCYFAEGISIEER